MSRPPRPGPDVHERVQALLPWYVNGTLDEEQGAEVDAHVDRCEACRDELALQRAVSVRVRRGASVQPAPHAAMERLMARIDGHEAAQARRRRWRARLQRLFGATPGRVLERAVAVQAGAILLLAVVLVWSLTRPEPPPQFRTLTAPGFADGGAQLHVLPDDSLTAAGWRSLLRSVDGRVVHGPTADGVYVIELRRDGRSATPREVAAWLQAQPGVVLATALDDPEPGQ